MRVLSIQRWRGPEALPAPARAEPLKGELKTFDFESKALGATRKVRVYVPPGHDRTKSYHVIYATAGNDGAHVLEPLITSGKVPPLIVVAASSGEYLGDRAAGYDPKKGVRSMEYRTGEDPERYAKHETFFSANCPRGPSASSARRRGAGTGPSSAAQTGRGSPRTWA
jgi:hypothetical protein